MSFYTPAWVYRQWGSMAFKQFYLRQAELCLRLAAEAFNKGTSDKLLVAAADFHSKAQQGQMSPDKSSVAPDVVGKDTAS
jgi:hypothetical protein